MPNQPKSPERWLDTAVSGIRFAPDRKKVRRELAEHLEDKTADLRRIFPDIPEEEAQERALNGMGDPEELKLALAKVHKPWLGRLWQACFTLLCLLTAGAALCNTAIPTEPDYSNSLRGRNSSQIYHRVRNGERAQLGQYTFQITAAAYLDVPEDGIRRDNLQLALRVSSPRFWERVDWSVVNDLTAVGPDGTRYPMDRAEIRMSREDSVYQLYTGAEPCEWDVFWREFVIYLPAEGWEPGGSVTLELDSSLGGISLSAPVTERVVVP